MIDNTYNARQMAIGMGDQRDGMTSTTYEDDSGSDLQLNETPQSASGQVLKLQRNFQKRQPYPESFFITVGSSKSDVVRIQGTPTSIIPVMGTTEWWWYGTSYIVFEKSRVASWSSSGNLRVKMY